MQTPIYKSDEEQHLMVELWSPALADDPEAFVLFAFPWGQKNTPLHKFKGPRKWQREVLRDIKTHIANNQGKVQMDTLREAVSSGRGIGKSALVSWLTDQIPAHGDWLVQERLFNHDRLRSIAMNALSTTRITTMLDEHGSAEVVAAVQRLPLDATTCIDNTSGGGLIAGVDEKSGQLLPAKLGRSRGDLGRRYAVHPLSGSAIAGVELPFWGQCLELARHAHAVAFREYTMVGWDVGITNGGPVLIEGNGKPSIVINQRGTGRAAGDGRLGELLRYHLGKAACS